MIESPTTGMGRYLAALRWESRLVVTLLVATPVAYVVALRDGHKTVLLTTILVALIGTLLAYGLRRTLRKDYLHIGGVWLVLGILPPFCFGAIIFGMVQTWMQRVGFGMKMRIGVVTTLATLLSAMMISDSTALIAVFLLVNFVSALVRERAEQNWYLVPCSVLILVMMAFSW